MDHLVPIIVWLNTVSNAIGGFLLAPIALLPGWLSATIVAVVTGVLLLAVFKYTSNQGAIKKVRDDIKANLLALKLFKDSIWVTFGAQGRLFMGAFWLLVYGLVPMLVMMVPVLLILGQMSLWYQAAPLHVKTPPVHGNLQPPQVDDEAIMTVKLNGTADSPWPEVRLEPTQAVEVTKGPIKILSQREICWNIKARENGYHRLVFQVNGVPIEKDLAIGDGFMRVSARRPGWAWLDVLEYPWEQPFGPDSAVQSIEIVYPERNSWTSGTNSWVIYWFVASMIGGFCFRGVLKVNI